MTEMATLLLGKVHTTGKENGEFQERFRNSKKESNKKICYNRLKKPGKEIE